MQSNQVEFIDVAKKLVVFTFEKQFTYEYLLSIGCPQEILDKEFPYVELHDWLDKQSDKCHLHIMKMMFEEKAYESVTEIKKSKLLRDLNLPLCEFWLEFLENVKENFLRCELQLMEGE